MKINYYFLALSVILLTSNLQAQTISQTYSAGDIPTSFNAYSASCNGPLTTLSLGLPAGGPWEVTGFDVAYDMTAANVAYMSEQRSRIYFQNASTQEPTDYAGTGLGGTFSYNRTGVNIANGYYPGGTNLIFEMRAWRTWGSTSPNDGCGTYYNKVNNNTWTITVHYQLPPTCVDPQNIQVNNITLDEAEVSWTEIGTATQWDIEYGIKGFAQGTGTTVNVTNNTYLITGLTDLTEYDVYVRSNCGPGDESFWVGPKTFKTAADCSAYALSVTAFTGGSIVCKGVTTLTATGSGTPNSEIYWYDALTNGNIVGTGTSFTTPILTTTTSFYAAEVIVDGGSGGGTGLPSYCIPIFSSGCGFGDDINDFVMIDAGINHIGSGCSPNSYGNFTSNQNLTGNLVPGETYNFSITHNYSGQWVKIWVDFNGNGSFEDAGELLFASTTGGSVTIGSITIPSSAQGGATVMRVMARWLGAPTTSCTSGGAYGETHDYTVMVGQILCESTREEVIATVTQDGDILVPATLPYIDSNNNTSNYGNTFSGAPGLGCGTTENYLNGNDVVYMFTPTTNDYIDIKLSDLTDFYAGLFVYESCGNIGDDCVAGTIAGPSKNDISIDEFPVTAGQTYYIVVSTWLTPSIGYTLEINGFVCANFPAPIGDINQDFASPATLADLEVEGTTPSSTLIWYSDPAGTSVISDTTQLVNGTIYYVRQNFNNCDSPLLAITVTEIDCTNLDIVSTTGGSVVCLGSVTLGAVASGTGSEIYWYASATGGDPLETGSTFQTPVLTNTTSYWVSEVFIDGEAPLSGQAKPTYTNNESTSGSDWGLVFNAYQAFTIRDVQVFSTGAGGNITIELQDNTGFMLAQTTVMVPGGGSATAPIPYTAQLNFNIPGPGTYRLINKTAVSMIREFSNNIFPYPLGSVGEVTSGYIGGTSQTYYWFYNWTIGTGSVLCESPREEVIATVTGDGDVVVPGVPYTTTDNTTLYGNNFSGSPGSDCGATGNYLGGNDVVYQYTPAADDIVNIKLTGVSNQNAGLFVYESCGDIGTNCVAGTIRQGGIYEIENFYMTAGQSYYIVISTQTGTTGYTLNITGFACTDLEVPTGEQTQYYVLANNTIADLSVNQNQYSTGVTWYSDAGNTQVFDTTVLVDGHTYYVSQTVLGCESPLLAVTVIEFQCSDLNILSTTDDTVCGPGVVTLTAQPSGVGSEIYWYDAQINGNLVGVGASYSAFITNTKDYWATEVFLNIASGTGTGTLPTYCIPTHGGSGCGVGDNIDNFVMTNAGINHLSSGCSPNAYGNFTSDSNLLGLLTAGQSYAFSVTHTYQSSQYIKIWIDFNNNGSFEDAGELLFTSISGSVVGTTTGTINIPQTAMATTTVMRVSNRFGAVPGTSCLPGGTYGETHDYKVIITGADIVCNSPREKATGYVNTVIPNAPVGSATQQFCDEQYTIADLAVTGTNIAWYNSSGAVLPSSTVLLPGVTYYATQTINMCESAKLAVSITIIAKSSMPQGNGNQTYQPGDTLEDLIVTGQNLTWYSDSQGINEIPATTVLQDVNTYYVTQTESGLCPSDMLAIMVHRGALGVVDVVFANLQYYPNPVDRVLTITNSFPIDAVEVYSLLGQKVSHQQVGFATTTLDMSGLASGAYLLKVIIDDKVGFYRVIKK